MSQTLYGAVVFHSPTKETNTDGGLVIGKNSVAFTANDLVAIDNTNGLEIATASTDIYGVVMTTQTMGASNQTVQLVKPMCFVPDQSYQWLMGTNADLSPLTSVGQYYAITGTTGIMQVDVNGGAVTGASRQVVCLGVDPNAVGGTGTGSGVRQGLFQFVKIQNFTQG